MSALDALLDRGPFPGQMDLWAEHAHYFHGLHEQMIGEIIAMLKQPLRARGYVIARETSLQFTRQVIADSYITDDGRAKPGAAAVRYQTAAAAVMADVGFMVDDVPVPTALKIYRREPYQLVTMIEIISPSNKNKLSEIENYMARRDHLHYAENIHIVEIDITRSYNRMLNNTIVDRSPYHAAVHVVDETTYFIPMSRGEPFKRIAIPLLGDAVALDLDKIYQQAYEGMGLANLMRVEGFYTSVKLPFPSLLTDAERDEALAAVAAWQDAIRQATDAMREEQKGN